MNIRELIKKDFGVDLPIRGGVGNSIDNPVIIERTERNDFVTVEYAYLKYIGIGRRITWKVIQQELMHLEDRTIDQLKLETVELTPTEKITQIENYYFDITACWRDAYIKG